MDLEKAPEKGMMYALYIDKVVYEPYASKDSIKIENNLLELHLFDSEKEYRFITRRNQDPIKEVISDEIVLGEEATEENSYEEEIFTLKDKMEKLEDTTHRIKVVNYISYDENDLLTIENYRLKEVKN